MGCIDAVDREVERVAEDEGGCRDEEEARESKDHLRDLRGCIQGEKLAQHHAGARSEGEFKPEQAEESLRPGSRQSRVLKERDPASTG